RHKATKIEKQAWLTNRSKYHLRPEKSLFFSNVFFFQKIVSMYPLLSTHIQITFSKRNRCRNRCGNNPMISGLATNKYPNGRSANDLNPRYRTFASSNRYLYALLVKLPVSSR